jgi:hypothetical protein
MLLTNSSAPPMSMPMLTRTCATIWKLFGGSFFVVSKYKLPGSSAPPSCLPWTIVFQVTAAYVGYQQRRAGQPQRARAHEPDAGGQQQGTQNDVQVPGYRVAVRLQPRTCPPGPVDERGGTTHRHGQRGEQERRPDDGADRDRACLLALGDDRR